MTDHAELHVEADDILNLLHKLAQTLDAQFPGDRDAEARVSQGFVQDIAAALAVLEQELTEAQNEVVRLQSGSEIPALRQMVLNQRDTIRDTEAALAEAKRERDEAQRKAANFLAQLSDMDLLRAAAESRVKGLEAELRGYASTYREQAFTNWKAAELALDAATKALREISTVSCSAGCGDFARAALAATEDTRCPHADQHFDRSLCACGAMHTYCNDCGINLDECTAEVDA